VHDLIHETKTWKIQATAHRLGHPENPVFAGDVKDTLAIKTSSR
jgi:hypothetical protein